MNHLNTHGLESALEKVARSLSDKFGINVVFQGDRCCTNGRTIYLPSLPDDLPPDMIMVIRGWLDHEASHILFSTDMQLVARFQKEHGPNAFGIFNILEDARVEAAVSKRFPGSGFNLRMCYEEAAARAQALAQKEPLPILAQLAFAVHTHVNGLPYLDFVGQEIRELVDGLSALLLQVPHCPDCCKVAAIALKVWEKVRPLIEREKAKEFVFKTPAGDSHQGDPAQSVPSSAAFQGIIGGMAEGISGSIGEYAKTSHAYRAWSTAYDRVVFGQNVSTNSHQERMREVMPLVSGVRRKLLQSLLAEPKARWLGDREQGAVNPRSLHRLALPNADCRQRIFRQRIRTRRLRTAVTLLVDESSSMSGPKLALATITAMVFCEALSRLNIPTSVVGFSTMKYTLESIASQQTGMKAEELRGMFRLHPLCHTVYKRFDEPFAKVSGRMEGMTAKSITPLGESMLFAAHGLLQRPEERKVLFVMTDGKPVAGIAPEDITFAHAKRAIARIEKAGIDVAQVGIMEYSVTHLHHRSVVVPSLDKLPRAVMSQLRSVLTKQLSL
ncbi:MAG: hypothetical protein LUG50_07350 [Planctomycetaceae bacterium]|nr:hypothetical protein [Planctomycetaceae bacterium]